MAYGLRCLHGHHIRYPSLRLRYHGRRIDHVAPRNCASLHPTARRAQARSGIPAGRIADPLANRRGAAPGIPVNY